MISTQVVAFIKFLLNRKIKYLKYFVVGYCNSEILCIIIR